MDLGGLLVMGFSALFFSMLLLMGYLVFVRPSVHKQQSEQRLPALASALGFGIGSRKLKLSWLDVERTAPAIRGEIGGRIFTVHYRSSRPPRAPWLRTVDGVSAPIYETWVETAISPGLGLGVDELADPLNIRRGMGPEPFGALSGVGETTNAPIRARRAAGARMVTLLDHPSVAVLSVDVGAHVRTASDRVLAIVVSGHADLPRIQAACAAAAQIADLLPRLRLTMSSTPLDEAVARLGTQLEAHVRQHGAGGMGLTSGLSGMYLTIDVDTRVPLHALHTFARWGQGLAQLTTRGQVVPLRPPYDTPSVQQALRVLDGARQITMILIDGSTARFAIDPSASASPQLIGASVALAEALRHATLKGTSL